MISTPRYEDYNIKYSNANNMFAFMGLGFTRNQAGLGNGDLSPYITKEGIEKKFYTFKPLPDEERRVAERRNKVNEGPNKLAASKDSGRTNGTLTNGNN